MKKTSRHVVLVPIMALTLFLGISGSTAFAENNYFGFQLGATFLNDADFIQPGEAITASFDTGFLLGLTIGKKFDNIRLEGELSYRRNDVDTLFDGVTTVPGGGDVTSSSIMANGYYDIKTSSFVTPFIGFGVGLSQVSMNSISEPGEVIFNDDDMVFAYQLIAGIAFNISQSTKLDLAYKYFTTSDPSGSDVVGVPFDAEYSSHNLTLGLRFGF